MQLSLVFFCSTKRKRARSPFPFGNSYRTAIYMICLWAEMGRPSHRCTTSGTGSSPTAFKGSFGASTGKTRWCLKILPGALIGCRTISLSLLTAPAGSHLTAQARVLAHFAQGGASWACPAPCRGSWWLPQRLGRDGGLVDNLCHVYRKGAAVSCISVLSPRTKRNKA
jgi:hypothetical protein